MHPAYNLIIGELQTATAYANAFVDRYNQQEQNDEVLSTPALFVEMAPQISWTDLGNGQQNAHTFFTVHIVTDAPTTGLDRIDNLTQLDHYNLVRNATKGLHRKFFADTELLIEHITRRSTLYDASFELLEITRVVFDCRLLDTIFVKELTEATDVQPTTPTTMVAFISDINP